ncbi:carbamate kinase [uncultured Fretibacterium sp.]|uniref:carbamate kinase n=1 Tax=uncultured Fretibacterium sp. TaxID=1678694 RepID=UPI0026203668|nr:carbamate kinase [uncultured Fretibacterium sp.]
MSKVVVALGGNALGNTPEGQIEAVRKAAPSIMGLVKAGHQVVIGHGNGPQVGMINNAFDFASQGDGKTPYMPLVECGAMSQGYIGYHLQQALQAEAERVGLKLDVVSVVTQVEVSAQDPSFQDPSKPVGNFCSKEEADAIAAEKGWTFVEDAGRGYRRVVPSPLPVKIVEMDAIKKMMEMGMVVIAVGGGGIPVICKGDRYVGIDAVIDKDRSSARLASDLDADALVILTAVDRVAINFNKPNQKDLAHLTVAEAKEYMKSGEFAKGSMLPKVEACLAFVEAKKGRKAVITSLALAAEALKGEVGTVIEA